MSLADLPDDVLAKVLHRLKGPREVLTLALCCRRLRAVCCDDARVWAPLCAHHWGNVRPESWLHSGAGPSTAVFEDEDDGEEDEADKPATTYRQVFATLRRMQPLIGLWRGVGDAPYGSLFRIAWSAPTPALRRAGSTPLAGATATARAPAGGDEEPGTPSAGASRRTSGTNAAGGACAALGATGGGGGGGGHVEVVALRGGKELTELAEELTARVGPTGTLGTSLQLVDESLAILKDKPWRRAGGPGGAGGPSAAALAAAAVATGTHALSIRDRSGTSPAGPGGSAGGGGAMSEHPLGLLGASPPKSFGYEMLRFMAGSVAGSRSGGRKKDKRGGGGGMGGMVGGPAGGGVRRQAVILQHLVRLKVAAPSRQRPMSGVWSGVYGPHGLEVVSLGYEGTGSRARLVATKVTGDPNVPAGQVSFWAEAEPLPQPWPLSEVELISNRPFFTSNPALELANAVAAATAEAEAAAAAAAAGGAAPAVVPPGVLVVPPGVLPAPAALQVAPVWAQPGMAAAIGQAAPAAPPPPPPLPVPPPPPPLPDAGLGALDPQAAIQAQLAAAAAAAAAAEPADLWALLRPQPPPAGVPTASMSRTGSTTTVGLAGQEAAAHPGEATAVAAGATEPPPGAAARRTPLRVVAIYKGQGRVAGAGFSNPAWIDGRLWVYDNGRIGFLWRGDFDFIVDLERLSAAQCGLDLSGSSAR